ncbi:LytR/AlgR family response regulator transcription factor [Chitinophaga rhizosphaerae]|uniref:LytR/AlgR family response regulator transcription factor n=1 Tax=Chitinophaga rhizosphaerae TaxID=1864947 RepID=UPI000F8036FE|nr:LytTR family DNA-binding domain-containing protein [Chitinophaga rhizosphaerae]
MKIRCAITDDEPQARKGLKGYVEQVPFLELAGVCENAMALNELLRTTQVDLVFLDIEMPYLSGIDLLKSLQRPPKVIFTTAFEQYALKGFELEAVDYLLKPVTFERFLKAANRAHDLLSAQPATPVEDHLFIRTDDKFVRIQWADILYVESMENYVRIHTLQGSYITHATLKSVLEHLPDPPFLQTHKSYIINTRKITGIEGNVIALGKLQVPLSRTLRDTVLERLLRDRLLKK